MKAWLRNSQNCTFDNTDLETLEEVIEWAKGRGGSYTLMIEGEGRAVDYYKIQDDAVTYQATLED